LTAQNQQPAPAYLPISTATALLPDTPEHQNKPQRNYC